MRPPSSPVGKCIPLHLPIRVPLCSISLCGPFVLPQILTMEGTASPSLLLQGITQLGSSLLQLAQGASSCSALRDSGTGEGMCGVQATRRGVTH